MQGKGKQAGALGGMTIGGMVAGPIGMGLGALAGYGLGGLMEGGLSAEEAVAEVRAVDPGYGRRMAADLDGRLLHPRLAAAIVGDAERAGLGGPPTRGAGPARPKSVVS